MGIPKVWNDVLDERLETLRDSGVSSKNIAIMINEEFGTSFTRNSVIGRASRIGLPIEDKRRKAFSEKATMQPKRPREPRKRKLPLPTPKKQIEALPMNNIMEEKLNGVKFENLGSKQCRYALGEFKDPVIFYCGEPVAETMISETSRCPYCAFHAVKVYPNMKKRFSTERTEK